MAGIDPSMFKTEQVFFDSKDGTRVPMFIISRADRDSGMPAPTVLCKKLSQDVALFYSSDAFFCRWVRADFIQVK